ncbi:MAG: hypothetical protein ACRYFS_13960 [Janthinobacterium lividum]
MNTPMKAMFWKECHETARWAILAGLALTLGLTYAWYHQFGQSEFLNLGQFWSGENLVLTITMPLIGLALGLMQILPELRRDQWAFLVHRPASRTTLFWGKVLPGVCLYLLATVLPLLGLAAWAAQPSHIPAPFDFRFTLAGWASILSGLPFYFAGLLVAVRPARWYGSRALPIVAALIAPFAAVTLTLFWQAALVSVLVTVVLLCAAWGSFVTSGDYSQQTKSARFVLGMTLYPGAVAVSIAALMLLFGTLNALSHSKNQEGWRTTQQIDLQEHVYWHEEHTDRFGHNTTTVMDLAGKSVDPRVWDNLNQNHKLFDLNYLSLGEFYQASFRYFAPDSYVLNLTSSDYVFRSTSSGSDAQQTFWYYETAAHQIVRYVADSRRLPVVSYLGPNGFGDDQEQAGKFEAGKPESTDFGGFHLLRFPKALYFYDVSRSVPAIHLLQSLPGGPGGATLLMSGDGPVQTLIVTSGNQMTAYTGDASRPATPPKKLFTAPLMFDPKVYTNVQVAMTPDRSRFFFLYQPEYSSGSDHLITLASDGHVLQSQIIAAKGLNNPPKMRFSQAAPAMLFPPGLVAAATLYASIGSHLGWSSAWGLWEAATNIPVLFFSTLGGLVAAFLAWLISRRCGDSRRGQFAWAFGTFWLGIYGVLLLLALRAWPARLPCPNCGRSRAVDRDSCEHCGAQWVRPMPDGTEIFDAIDRETAVR